jgi:PAS domain S-box-containing protein
MGSVEQPEEGKRDLERQLAVAQQIAHLGSWEWDLHSNRVVWSDELYRIYGLEPQSCPITYESFLTRVHPDDRAHVRSRVAAAIERGGGFAYPERIVRPDGSMRFLESAGEVMRGPDGRVAGLIGTCRDVTEERRRDERVRLYEHIVHNVQIGLSVWTVEAPGEPTSIRLVAYNPAAETIMGMALDQSVGRTLREIVPFAAGGQFEALLGAVARDGGVREATVLRSKDPTRPRRALAMKVFSLPGGSVGAAFEDITAQTRERAIRDGEHRALEMIASGGPLDEILTQLVLLIEDHAQPVTGSILVLDETGTHVRHGAGPHLPEAFRAAIDGTAIGPTAGPCGAAAFLRQPVFVEDIEASRAWVDYRALARTHGLRACWSTPIFATHGGVLGTFAFYYREPRAPTDADRDLIARVTHIAGIAIERRQMEDQLRALSAREEAIREDERTGIAREIHDEFGQALTAMKMDLAWVGRHLGGSNGLSQAELRDKLAETSQMVDEIIGQVRRISGELRPGVLDDFGLFAAVEWQAHEFERRTGTACVLQSNLGDARLNRDLSTALFRIFQEALTNVARHAEARRVEVRLDRRDGALELEVRDDGRGVAAEAVFSPKSLGLLGMRERARRLGGSAIVGPAAPAGTTVLVRVPAGNGATPQGAL